MNRIPLDSRSPARRGKMEWMRFLDENMSVSTALPCRISIYEENGKTTLATIKPTAMLALFDTPQLGPVAQEVEDTIVKIMKEAAAG